MRGGVFEMQGPNVVQLHPEPSTEELIDRVHRQFYLATTHDKKAFNARVQVGETLITPRARVEQGEMGAGVKWWDWYGLNILRSRRDGEKCIALG